MWNDNLETIEQVESFFFWKRYSHLPKQEMRSLIMLAVFDLFTKHKFLNGKYAFSTYLQRTLFYYRKTLFADFEKDCSSKDTYDIKKLGISDIEKVDLMDWLTILDPTEQEVLIEYDLNGKTLHETGEVLGCSHEWVRKIRKSALEKLEKSLS